MKISFRIDGRAAHKHTHTHKYTNKQTHTHTHTQGERESNMCHVPFSTTLDLVTSFNRV